MPSKNTRTARTFRKHRTMIKAQQWGNNQGPTILCLHGWQDNSNSFSSLAPLLSDYQVIALDLPGHGLSHHKSPDASYVFVDWLRDVHECLHEINSDSVILLGHSMGAGISTLYAGLFPERVAAVIAIDGLTPIVDEKQNHAERYVKFLQMGERLSQQPNSIFEKIEDALARRSAATPEVAAHLLLPIVQRNLRKTPAGWQWRHDPRLKLHAPWRMSISQVMSYLVRVSCPIFMMKAIPGFQIPDYPYKDFMAQLRQLKVMEVPGSHYLHLEHPDFVASHIQSWLETIKKPIKSS